MDASCLVYWCSLEPAYSWLVQVFGPVEKNCISVLAKFRSLWLLDLALQSPDLGVSMEIKVALVTLRSLVNKTFILKDFFTSFELDLLFITETWLTNSDLSLIVQLLTSNCAF